MKAFMIASAIATLLFMSLRFYCKQYLGTKLALDDLVLAFSWVRSLFQLDFRAHNLLISSWTCRGYTIC